MLEWKKVKLHLNNGSIINANVVSYHPLGITIDTAITPEDDVLGDGMSFVPWTAITVVVELTN